MMIVLGRFRGEALFLRYEISRSVILSERQRAEGSSHCPPAQQIIGAKILRLPPVAQDDIYVNALRIRPTWFNHSVPAAERS
jgi:hypothetical protein